MGYIICYIERAVICHTKQASHLSYYKGYIICHTNRVTHLSYFMGLNIAIVNCYNGCTCRIFNLKTNIQMKWHKKCNLEYSVSTYFPFWATWAFNAYHWIIIGITNCIIGLQYTPSLVNISNNISWGCLDFNFLKYKY